MTKTFKRFLALLMTVMLIFSVVPTTVFAAEVPPEPESAVSREAPQEPEPTPLPEVTPGPSKESSQESSSSPTPEVLSSPEPDEKSVFDTELATVDADKVWPAIQRAKARAAAGAGTAGVLQMGYYCFKSEVGTLTTLGEYVSQLPAKTMLFNGTNVAAYCLEHTKGATGGTPYTWADMTVNAQDTVGTIMALGFQWSAADFWNGPSDNGDKWAVTQLLIWETIASHAFMQENGLFGVEAAVDTDMEKCAPRAYNPTKFLEYYRDLKKRLNDYMKVPSFANREPGKASTITLKWDGSKYSATVTDINGVLEYFPFQNSLSGVTVTRSGNKLTLSTATPILTPKISSKVDSRMAVAGGKGAVAVWRTSDSSQQSFATYNAAGGNPVSCYIKVKTDAVGSAGLKKTSEDGKVEGIQFQITGSDGSSTTKTTDASGNIDIDGLPIYSADGSKITYTATEVNVPSKYVKPQSQTFQLTEGQTASIHFENKLKRWRVTVTKSDEQTGSTSQGNGSLKGATFGVYQGDTLVKEYTVGDDNTFTTDYFPYGEDWTLKEISAGEGYKVNTVVTDLCEIPAGSNEEFNDNTATVTNEVIRGGVSVEKRDSQTGERPQGNADFSGITFEIINDSRNPVIVGDKSIGHGEVALTLTTDSEGKASTAADALPYGAYILHESATNESMLNTAPDQPVEVTENGKVYPFYMDNEVVRGGVLIEKRDLESLLPTPLGGASLDGTLFEITNKSRNAVYVNGALYQPDEVCLTIEVKDGVAQSDVRALPYGSYELAESKPGTGYLWTDKTIRPFDVLIDGSVKEYREGNAAYNQVKRGDLRFVKVGEKNMHRFANVAFKLTSQTTGESHILVTDQNGEVRTETKWNPHTQNTNGNDDKPEAEWDDETGAWFGQTTEDWMVETQDGLCALPYDYYRLEELRCEDNKGYALVTVPNIFISRDSTVIELGTIDDHEEGIPEIGTTATVDVEKTAEPVSEVTIVDTVRYSGLTVGKTYKLSGVLMDKSSGAPLLMDGQQVTAEKEFAPESVSGTEEITFTFDASALAGKSVVVYETLYHEGKEVAVHADINDLGQTVEFTTPDKPEIKTTAAVEGEKKAEPKGEVTITDTVSYTGLTPGKQYEISGILMDKSTGEKLLVDGKEVASEMEFTPESASGTEEITFTFDASALAGKSVVVFETLFHEDKEVAVHADINDKDQTVEFEEPDKPHIKTKATVDGEKEVDPLEKITLTDTVTYSNLTPGKTYAVKGVLMEKSTGEKLLIDGKEVTAETEFTPDKSDGSVDLTFTFNASCLAGKSVVAFETLYNEGVEVAVHDDIEDDDQTVVIRQPKLKTTATIGGKKEATISKELVLEDKVAYTGLTPDREYTVKGVLMDKSTGKKLLLDGKEVTAEATFTPEKPEGEVTVTFMFDASGFKEKTKLVVFETLYRDGKEIATHSDINDDGQTVTLTPEKPKTPTPDVPKTGDDRNIMLPLILLGASLAGLAVLFLFRFRGKKRSSQTGYKNDR